MNLLGFTVVSLAAAIFLPPAQSQDAIPDAPPPIEHELADAIVTTPELEGALDVDLTPDDALISETVEPLAAQEAPAKTYPCFYICIGRNPHRGDNGMATGEKITSLLYPKPNTVWQVSGGVEMVDSGLRCSTVNSPEECEAKNKQRCTGYPYNSSTLNSEGWIISPTLNNPDGKDCKSDRTLIRLR